MANYRDRIFVRVKEMRAERQEFLNDYNGMDEFHTAHSTSNVVRDLMACI